MFHARIIARPPDLVGDRPRPAISTSARYGGRDGPVVARNTGGRDPGVPPPLVSAPRPPRPRL